LSPSFFLGGGKIDGLFSAMEIIAAAMTHAEDFLALGGKGNQ
jgi:hypothetical protein